MSRRENWLTAVVESTPEATWTAAVERAREVARQNGAEVAGHASRTPLGGSTSFLTFPIAETFAQQLSRQSD